MVSMKVSFICLLWLIGLVSSTIAQEKEYIVKGHLLQADVPIKAFISFRNGDMMFSDSTMVEGDRFLFRGTLEHPTEATMYVHWSHPEGQGSKGTISEGIQFMLGYDTVYIEGQSLYKANIRGGKLQQDYEDLKDKLKAGTDSVVHAWRVQQEQLKEDSAASFQRLLSARGAVYLQVTKNFIVNNPSSALSFDILRRHSILIEDVEFVQNMIDVLKPAFGSYDRFKAVEQRAYLIQRLTIGQPAIDFVQTNEKGELVSLADFKGKFVLIDFWASWCGPCRAEYPYLKKAYEKYKGKNFEIIGISLDDKENHWQNAIKTNAFEWVQLSDLKGRNNAIAKAYGIAAIPQSFLLDMEGRIIAKNLRGDDLLDKLAEIIP